MTGMEMALWLTERGALPVNVRGAFAWKLPTGVDVVCFHWRRFRTEDDAAEWTTHRAWNMMGAWR
jgi:hypothetical protein